MKTKLLNSTSNKVFGLFIFSALLVASYSPPASAMEDGVEPSASVAYQSYDNSAQDDYNRQVMEMNRVYEANSMRQGAAGQAGHMIDPGLGGYAPMQGAMYASAPRNFSSQIQRLSTAYNQNSCTPCPDLSGGFYNISTGGADNTGAGFSPATHEENLKAREKELKKDLAKRRSDFLKSKAGKAMKKKFDQIEKDRQKKVRKAKKKHDARVRKEFAKEEQRCCVDGRAGQFDFEWMLTKEKISDEAKEAGEKAIEDEMSKTDPKGGKEYKEARKEFKDVSDKLLKIRQARAMEQERQRRAQIR